MTAGREKALMLRAVACAIACLLPGAAAARTLDGIECRATGQKSEVFLLLKGMPTPRILELDSPARLVIDLEGTRKTVQSGPRELPEGPVERVRVGQFAEHPLPITRIVADLRRPCRYDLQWIEGGLALVLTDKQVAAEVGPVNNGDVLRRFRDVYHRGGDPEGAMALLHDGIRESKIRFDDTESLKAVLDDVADYHAFQQQNDKQFMDLVTSMLDEGRIRLIVDQFHDKALREGAPENGVARTGRQPRSRSAAPKRPADRYSALYSLAVAAERRWRAPAALTIHDLASVGHAWKPLTYSITGKNRAGRNVTLPANLIVQVIPPDAAKLDANGRTLIPMRVGPFVLRTSTADGALQAEKQVHIQPMTVPEEPMASLTPGHGVLEIDERAEFTITANNALQQQRWRVDWEPDDVLSGLRNYEDSCKAVITIHARQSGVGRLLVTGGGKELGEAQLYVLPPAPSKTLPATLTVATAAAVAGAFAAADHGNTDLKVWLGYGAVPTLALSAMISWWRYRDQEATRARFLEEQPAFEGSPPVASATIPRERP